MLKELWSTYYFDGMNFRSFVVYYSDFYNNLLVGLYHGIFHILSCQGRRD